jgi:hypothetical protein
MKAERRPSGAFETRLAALDASMALAWPRRMRVG